ALAQALKNPLMNKGKMLEDAAHVLVQVAGGPGMTLSEVEILMQELGRHISDQTQILFGTAVDSRMGNRLSVTIISSLGCESGTATVQPVVPTPVAAEPPPPIWEEPVIEQPAPIEATNEIVDLPPPADDLIQFPTPEPVQDQQSAVEQPMPVKKVPPLPRIIIPKQKPVAKEAKEPKPPQLSKAQAKQEVLQFEPVTRGRFEKSEPTIVEGQDLDVPTFLRKNFRVT
ncbi:MAG: cell division protein FtsZ, partial [Verrucomicrobiota bacterium]